MKKLRKTDHQKWTDIYIYMKLNNAKYETAKFNNSYPWQCLRNEKNENEFSFPIFYFKVS
jgi:hypothetical protein